jgi:flavin-dependent dehydrogenase
MAGLCAARVLAERFVRVVVVDRDTLPSTPSWRRQVPQGRQPHLLLQAGARLLEAWFPGLTRELEAAGAVDVDVCADLFWYQAGGAFRRPASSVRGPAMSRPLLEQTVRRRVAALGNVVVRGATTATGILADGPERIVGARLADGSTLACDLLVDATGRRAHSLAWLGELGYEPPATEQVGVDIRYVSCEFRRTSDPGRDWKGAGIVGDVSSRRLSVALPLEGDRWIVGFGGFHGESAPTDLDGFRRYARTLPSPVIAELVEACEPLTEPAVHRFPASQRRDVRKLRRFPTGWVLTGDAVGSFNPIYGQGMSTAAQQAAALGSALDRSGAVDRRFARRYFAAASRTVDVAWSIAVGGDFADPATTGRKPLGTDVLNRYMDRVFVAAQHDDTVVVRANEVLALTRRPEVLLAPRFVARVLRSSRRRTSNLATPPARSARLRAGPATAQSATEGGTR